MTTSAALRKSATVAHVAAKLGGTTIGEMVDDLYRLREDKRALEVKIAEVEGTYKGIEEELLERLANEKTDAARGKAASCSVTSSVSANVTDWDELHKFVKKTGHTQLYFRRISDPAFRELLEQKGKVPGVEPFIRKRLNVRTLPG